MPLVPLANVIFSKNSLVLQDIGNYWFGGTFHLDHKFRKTGTHLPKGPVFYLWDLSIGHNVDSVSVHKVINLMH
jgi:hypothetical protein